MVNRRNLFRILRFQAYNSPRAITLTMAMKTEDFGNELGYSKLDHHWINIRSILDQY